MKYFLIMNPGSKGGRSQKKFKKIFEILDKNCINYNYEITKSLEDAYTFSLKANQEGFDIIVAIGGDGTINRAINGFYNSSGNRISNARFGVIYTGTSPDFCKSYGIPINLEQAVNTLINGKSKTINIGKIDYAIKISEASTDMKTGYFACCANIGIGASIARSANSGIRKYLGDYAGTFVSMLKTLITYKSCDYTVEIDSVVKNIKNVHNLSIGRTQYIASGIKVSNNIRLQDERFYSLTINNIYIAKLIGVFKKLYSGCDFVNDESISLEYLKRIEIFANKTNSEIEFDGDPAGFLPCFIEMAKEPLDLLYEV